MSRRVRLELLAAEEVGRVLEEAYRTLEEIGVLVENREALDVLAAAGAEIDGERRRVRIPRRLCEESLATVPGSFSLWDRDGEEAVRVGDGETVFVPGSAALEVLDLETGRSRPAETRDFVDLVRLVDRLPGFEVQSTALVPSDVPEELADRYRLAIALVHGRKPIITGTFTKEAFATMAAMLERVRGGEAALRDKPLAIFDCCPSPPLAWSDLTAQALVDCARRGIPATLVSVPLAGATGPVTLAGSLVQHTAENLSGAVIHQQACPGAPLVYGGSPACFDMRDGTTPIAAVEAVTLDAAYAQIGRHLGFPVHAYLGLSDAKLLDYQAGCETAMGAVVAALAGVDLAAGAGMLAFENCQSLAKLVADHEVCRMARRLARGVPFREEEAGIHVLRDEAERHAFLRSEHTRRFFRDEVYYPSAVIDRTGPGGSRLAGAEQRAHDEVRRRLSEPAGEPLEASIVDDLEAMLVRDAGRLGVDALPDWRSAPVAA